MLHIELIRHVKVSGKAGLYGKTDILPLLDENTLLVNALLLKQLPVKSPLLKTSYYDAVISSPLKRCAIVAKQFADIANIGLSIEDDIQEMDFGLYDGLSFDDLHYDDTTTHDKCVGRSNEKMTDINWLQLEAFFKSPAEVTLPQAESLIEFHYRVINAWKKIIAQQLILFNTQEEQEDKIEKAGQKSPSKGERRQRRVVIFAHGGVIRMILAHALALNWKKASWYQNLHIDYASLSHITIRPMSHVNPKDKAEPLNENEQYFQQVNTIGMPLIAH